MLLVTHNFNYEGAPLFLLEYAAWLHRETKTRLTVASSQDGPLRPFFEALGARVHLVDEKAVYDAKSAAEYHVALKGIHQSVDWKGIDVVYTNTVVCFWGVHLAKMAGLPSVFQIHESDSLKRFFGAIVP